MKTHLSRTSAKRQGAPRLIRRLLAGTVLLTASDAAAQAAGPARSIFGTPEVVTFSVLIGVISAAMISAIWLIRQRGNIEAENRDLRSSLSDANQHISRFQALIADKNRRIVIWDGLADRAEFLGHLPVETGAPQDDRDFLAFGRWVKPHSAGQLEKAIEALRAQAQSFDLVLETQRNEVLEAQGR
ncbi:alkaline phosphatase, partial [Sinorhizobium medicae]